MPGKVTDPALLAQLDGPDSAPGRVTDPALLSQLDSAPVEKTESAARGGLQGLTFGWGDEAAGAIAAAMPSLEPKAAITGKTWAERYQQARDYYRAKNRAAKEENPKTYLAGEVGGGIAPVVLTAGGAAAPRAVGLAGRAARGLKAGAQAGALYGAGASEAETPGGLVTDTALGAAIGGPIGGATPVVGALAKRMASPVAQWLERRAVESGRKALSGIGTPLSARKEIPAEVVNQALDTGAIKPFGTVTGAAGRLQQQADQLGEVYGKLIDDLAAAGVEGPNAELMAREALKKATAAGKVLARAEKGEWEQLAQDLREAVDPTAFASKRLGLTQVQEIKHNLQEASKREYDKIARQTSMKGEAMKKSAAFVREAMEQAIDEQAAKAPEAAAAFMPVKGRLANTLSALRVAEEGAARAARRAPPSVVPPLVVGGVTGSPGLGLLTLLGRLGDRRVASTVATASRGGAKALGALSNANLSPAQQVEAERLAALIAALRGPRFAPSLAAADEEAP